MLLLSLFPTRQIPAIQHLSRYALIVVSRRFRSCSSHFYAIGLRWLILREKHRLSKSTTLVFAVEERHTMYVPWRKLWEEQFDQANTHLCWSCILYWERM